MAQFINQINNEEYNLILNYEEHKVSDIPVEDTDKFKHVLLYDSEFVQQNFKNCTHLFIDATFKSRPSLSDCLQLLIVMGVLSGREFERQQATIFKFFTEKVKDGEMNYKKRVDINAFLDYFSTYWLKTVTPAGFSVFGLFKRTNNCCESFNSLLSRDWEKRPVPNDFCLEDYDVDKEISTSEEALRVEKRQRNEEFSTRAVS
ncbi:hypothetical protein TKK_0012463 [Trichogramma kaykai]